MSSWLPLVTCVALAACRPAPKGPRLPHGPLASSVAAWIPADAAVVVAIGPDGSAAIDDVTNALGWIGPGVLASIDPAVTAAWKGAAISPRGAVWMLWDDDARSTATCVVAGNAAKIATALEAAGGARHVSAGAFVVELGDTTTVLRDGVACVVESGAASRRAHYALDLAGMTDDERLLIARPDAAALLRALPAADVVVWGRGDLIGGLIEVVPGDATRELAGLGEPAIALAIDPATHQARITIASPQLSGQPYRPDEGALSPGALALLPPPARVPDLPLPQKDENPDVPISDDYKAAELALAGSLAEASMLRDDLNAILQGGRDAFDRAWGEARWARRDEGAIELVEVTWDVPTWPAASMRTSGEAAMADALAGEAKRRAEYEHVVAEVVRWISERIAIRARDVAAWDRAH